MYHASTSESILITRILISSVHQAQYASVVGAILIYRDHWLNALLAIAYYNYPSTRVSRALILSLWEIL